MCGIAGVVDFAHPPHTESVGPVPNVEPALARLIHRGPDDWGVWHETGVALGARRLSIIDVDGGHQPLANEDGTVVAVQNGEIYNFVELMAELEALGHRFRTRCDTEVLVHAWEEWGPACVERFRGMFALAVYDRTRGQLLLARDRFGIKPLYIHAANRRLVFASELPALVALLPGRPPANAHILPDLLSLGWAPGPQTVYEGVESVPAGACVLVTPGGLSRASYWQPDPPASARLDRPPDLAALLQGALAESVRLHMRSDVPVGALLSGGLDSSVLVALMRRTGHTNLHTFNIGFDDPAYDETRFARLAAEHLGVQHHTLRFGSEAFDLLPGMVAHYGQPVGSATHVAIWLLYAACAAQGLKVILTGEGADELFGGYQWYRGEQRLAAARRLPAPLRRAASRLAPALGASSTAADLLGWEEAGLEAHYRRWLTPHTRESVLPLLHQDVRSALIDAGPLPDPWRPLAALSPALAPLHQLTLLDWRRRLPDFINLEVDRMSMAHSVEARVPFLDHKLWETVLAWDPALNLAGGSEKAMLRQVAASLLPPEIIRRRKQGLASPHAAWWRQPRLPGWAAGLLTTPALAAAGLFDPVAVSDLLARHRAGRANLATPLTAILTTQLWLTQP